METGLTGRVVLVTGASSGIGRATARAFAAEGARIAITYYNGRESASRIADEIETSGGEAITVRMALEDPGSAEAAVAAVEQRWEAIDVLVANACKWPTEWAIDGRTETVPLGAWRSHIRANVEGTVATVHAALPALRRSEAGRIVIVSSSTGQEGLPGPSPYGVAKAALNGLMRQLAWDVGRDGVLVNAVAAGFTTTDRNLESYPASIYELVGEQIPSRRLSAPDDVASLIVFLGSEANRNVTGELICEGSGTGRTSHFPFAAV